MRKTHLVVLATLLLVLAAPLRACDDEEAQAYLIDEILRLSHEGVPDRIIIKQMRTMNFVFCLTADDIIELRELGVSDDILEALIETSLDVEEGRRQETIEVRVSPGYWSPWYRYPTGWGAYYDPFPYQFSFHYYPFIYECGWAWYGWSPNIYYYAYNIYNCPPYYSPHRGDYRDERPMYVERNRGSIIVDNPLGLGPGGSPVALAPPPRSAAPAAAPGVLQGSVDGSTLTVRSPYRSPDVVTPPQRAGNDPRNLTEARSDVLTVRNPGTAVQQPVAVQPPTRGVRPPVAQRTPPPTVDRRPPTAVKNPPRVTPKRSATTRSTPPPTRRASPSVKTPPPTRVTPAQRTPTRTPTRVTPPAQRTPPSTQVKAPPRSAPPRSAPPPKASRPTTKARSR